VRSRACSRLRQSVFVFAYSRSRAAPNANAKRRNSHVSAGAILRYLERHQQHRCGAVRTRRISVRRVDAPAARPEARKRNCVVRVGGARRRKLGRWVLKQVPNRARTRSTLKGGKARARTGFQGVPQLYPRGGKSRQQRDAIIAAHVRRRTISECLPACCAMLVDESSPLRKIRTETAFATTHETELRVKVASVRGRSTGSKTHRPFPLVRNERRGRTRHHRPVRQRDPWLRKARNVSVSSFAPRVCIAVSLKKTSHVS
jgi:hypothetical protein